MTTGEKEVYGTITEEGRGKTVTWFDGDGVKQEAPVPCRGNVKVEHIERKGSNLLRLTIGLSYVTLRITACSHRIASHRAD